MECRNYFKLKWNINHSTNHPSKHKPSWHSTAAGFVIFNGFVQLIHLFILTVVLCVPTELQSFMFIMVNYPFSACIRPENGPYSWVSCDENGFAFSTAAASLKRISKKRWEGYKFIDCLIYARYSHLKRMFYSAVHHYCCWMWMNSATWIHYYSTLDQVRKQQLTSDLSKSFTEWRYFFMFRFCLRIPNFRMVPLR